MVSRIDTSSSSIATELLDDLSTETLFPTTLEVSASRASTRQQLSQNPLQTAVLTHQDLYDQNLSTVAFSFIPGISRSVKFLNEFELLDESLVAPLKGKLAALAEKADEYLTSDFLKNLIEQEHTHSPSGKGPFSITTPFFEVLTSYVAEAQGDVQLQKTRLQLCDDLLIDTLGNQLYDVAIFLKQVNKPLETQTPYDVLWQLVGPEKSALEGLSLSDNHRLNAQLLRDGSKVVEFHKNLYQVIRVEKDSQELLPQERLYQAETATFGRPLEDYERKQFSTTVVKFLSLDNQLFGIDPENDLRLAFLDAAISSRYTAVREREEPKVSFTTYMVAAIDRSDPKTYVHFDHVLSGGRKEVKEIDDATRAKLGLYFGTQLHPLHNHFFSLSERTALQPVRSHLEVRDSSQGDQVGQVVEIWQRVKSALSNLTKGVRETQEIITGLVEEDCTRGKNFQSKFLKDGNGIKFVIDTGELDQKESLGLLREHGASFLRDQLKKGSVTLFEIKQKTDPSTWEGVKYVGAFHLYPGSPPFLAEVQCESLKMALREKVPGSESTSRASHDNYDAEKFSSHLYPESQKYLEVMKLLLPQEVFDQVIVSAR